MIIYLLYILSTVVGTWHPEGHSPLIYGQPPFAPTTPLHKVCARWNSQLSNCCCRFLYSPSDDAGLLAVTVFITPTFLRKLLQDEDTIKTPLVVGSWLALPQPARVLVPRYRYSFLSVPPADISSHCQYLNFISRKLTSVLLPLRIFLLSLFCRKPERTV